MSLVVVFDFDVVFICFCWRWAFTFACFEGAEFDIQGPFNVVKNLKVGACSESLLQDFLK